MVEPQIPRIHVNQEEKLRNKLSAEKREQNLLVQMATVPIGSYLPPGVEILIKPSAVAGREPSVVYRIPCKRRMIKASERTRKARTTTAVTAGTTALVEGSVINKNPCESSETLVENLNLEKIRISNV